MKAHKFVAEFGIDVAKEVLEVRAMDNFEEWFQSQDFYTNLRFIHGDALFLKDGDVYRVLVVRTASKAWQEQQKRVDEQAKEINFLNNRADDLALDQMKTAQFNYQLEQKIDELQARVDAALKETQHASRYVEEDMRGNHEFLQMAMIRTFKSLAQALKGGES